MCAICGIVNFNATESVDRAVLERMTSVQAHRGPDDHDVFVDGNVGLGHRRLSIIDLSGGKQPIFNEDESLVIVFNGEIYNYRELTQTLIPRDTVSDSIGHRNDRPCLRRIRRELCAALSWDVCLRHLGPPL